MAKSEPKTRATPRRRGILGGAEVRPSGPILVASAVVGCLALSALLTLEILPAPVVGFAGRAIVVGDISERDEKAPTALAIADPQATENLRREAVEKSPVVYDFDDNRRAELRERIAKAFTAARAALAPAARADGGRAAAAHAGDGVPRVTRLRDTGARRSRSSISRRPSSRPPTSSCVVQLVESVSARMIVDELAEFERHLEARTVVVRDLGSGNERALKSAQRVLTAETARAQLERGAELRSRARRRPRARRSCRSRRRSCART